MAVLIFPCAIAAGNQRSGFETTVVTEQGRVHGRVLMGAETTAWLGIPYAQPPLGALRWRAPQPLPPWSGILDATRYGHRCAQGENGPSSEDCLYLNVWRPSNAQRKLPVFVYIHGGSNLDGSGEGSWYTVAQHYDVVVVTFNYRLGPMGWFLHPALLTGNPEDDSGDYGSLDQISVLEWVRRNIEQFGGDAANVTLAGASAGAQNVSYLMHSALAKDLFQKAIIESNYPGIRPVSAAFKSSKQVLYNLLVGDGVAQNAAAAKVHADSRMSPQDIRDYLRAKTPQQIRDAYFNKDRGSINWGDLFRDDIAPHTGVVPPLVAEAQNRPEFVYAIGDGVVLPKGLPVADFSEGHVFPRPLIVGTTRNENNTWNAEWPFNYQTGKSLQTLVDEAVNGTNPSYHGLQAFYDAFGSKDPETFERNYKFATDLIDELDTSLAVNLAADGLTAVSVRPRVPVYAYRFDWGSDTHKDYRIPFQDAWTFYKGSLHTSESPFFYQSFFKLVDGDKDAGYPFTPANLEGRQALSLAIRCYLKRFLHDRGGRIAKCRDQSVTWEPWTSSAKRFIVFDADHSTPAIHMETASAVRTPDELYGAQAAAPNAAVRDFIDYYVLWSWQWDWYPNATTGRFDTSPGPNAIFDPANP
jgi:para-nitrobenzyl esterase